VVRIAIIVASALGTLGFAALLAVALGRAAAIADQESERHHKERSVTPSIAAYRQSYAGFARAQSTIARASTIACPSSITEPTSRTSVRTVRSPVNSCTSRRPGIGLKTPGPNATP
jgi:hypothetical protein